MTSTQGLRQAENTFSQFSLFTDADLVCEISQDHEDTQKVDAMFVIDCEQSLYFPSFYCFPD
jgi:hypothetical protein